jgi:hypothetical protein
MTRPSNIKKSRKNIAINKQRINGKFATIIINNDNEQDRPNKKIKLDNEIPTKMEFDNPTNSEIPTTLEFDNPTIHEIPTTLEFDNPTSK